MNCQRCHGLMVQDRLYDLQDTNIHCDVWRCIDKCGGNPGFVTLVDDRTLRIPDYPGNSMFNTLGNFTANPRAGLIFLDFESHRTLQLTGRPEILYDVDGTAEETGGTNRPEDWRCSAASTKRRMCGHPSS